MNWVDGVMVACLVLMGLVVIGDVVLALLRRRFGVHRQGTTWSELLREGIGISTLIPWTVAVLIGRWFPLLPPDSAMPFSIAFPMVLTASAVVTVVGDILMRRRRRPAIPPWIIVLAGLVLGGLLIPLAPTY